MTGISHSSGPTLLGKLRALEERVSATRHINAFNFTAAMSELADLLPAIIAQIESDEKDGRWHAITADRLGVFISQQQYKTRDEAIEAYPGAVDAWRNAWEEPARGSD